MTFQEWFNSAPHRAKYDSDHPAYLAAQEAWDAAHEACAKVCEERWEIDGTHTAKEFAAAIREALAEQPARQQEPVCDKDPQGCWSVRCQLGKVCKNTIPPASKPWVGLSTDEIYDMYNEPRSDAEMVEFARAIEAKLKEKNT